ncbi:MAG: SpoIIE family protein phosphatase [Acidobacteria bacterium]|nr:SpoIIE family protein phosphatase [Acidobacteriota bacterium]
MARTEQSEAKAAKKPPAFEPESRGSSTDALVNEVESLGGEFSAVLGPEEILRALAKRLTTNFGPSLASLWMTSVESKGLELANHAGTLSLPPNLQRLPSGDTVLSRAASRGQQEFIVDPAASDDPFLRWARQNKAKFLGVIPLIENSRVFAVLLVVTTKGPAKSSVILRLDARMASLALRDALVLRSARQAMTRLNSLVEASKALSSTLDLSELLGRILEVAKSHAGAERGTIFLVDEATNEIWSLIAHGLEKQEIRLPLGKGISGHVAKTGEVVLIPDAYSDPRFNPDVDKRTGYRTRTILCVPIRNKAGKILAALQLLNKQQGAFNAEDTDFLLTLSGHMGLALENAQLHQQILEKERMEKELALARGIQRSLLPDTTPVLEGFDIALLNEPCYAVGGDYYDFLTLGPHTLLTVIADVEGKGVSSALVMSNLQATLRALVLHLHSLDEIAESLNRMILNDTRSEKYLSIFIGLIDVRRRGLHYINCGHVPPVIIRSGQDPIPLTEGGMVIGLFETARYQRGQIKLQRGDVLVLCTDGITEAMDTFHEEYGMERVVQCIQGVAEKSATDIVGAVSADVVRFSRHGTHLDDKVMIAIKVV